MRYLEEATTEVVYATWTDSSRQAKTLDLTSLHVVLIYKTHCKNGVKNVQCYKQTISYHV